MLDLITMVVIAIEPTPIVLFVDGTIRVAALLRGVLRQKDDG